MYDKQYLSKYKYFKKVLEEKDLSYVLDPLTGLVSRLYILEFVKSLIEENCPFSFGMIDLDNFKEINDSYGHSTGDEVLSAVSTNLINYLSDYGVAGRYGGDELVFVDFRDLEYDQKKQFLNILYEEGQVLKINYKLKHYSPFVTGTIGMATFPDDAKDYDELFSLIDKTLYRGKSKGRNCYIIYVESKHKNIKIVELRKHSIYETIRNMTEGIEKGVGMRAKLKAAFEAIREDMHLTGLYYLDKEGIMRDVENDQVFGIVPDIYEIIGDNVNACNDVDGLVNKCPISYKCLYEKEIGSLLFAHINDGERTYGYLVCAEPRVQRIWQSEDEMTLYIFGKLLGHYLKSSGADINTLIETED